jgi:hypothetical protein
VKTPRSEPGNEKRLCQWCGHMVFCRTPPEACRRWYAKHRFGKGVCLGSFKTVEEEADPTWLGPPPILEAARAEQAAKDGGPSQ